MILDEIQYLPEILTTIKIMVDNERKPGSWFITGSLQFAFMKNVSETLAGRSAIFSLPTFQIREQKDITGLGIIDGSTVESISGLYGGDHACFPDLPHQLPSHRWHSHLGHRCHSIEYSL